MLERLLVPLDGSPSAESILPEVTVFAKRLGQPVVLLMVIPKVGELKPAPSDLDAELSLIHEQRRRYAEQYLDQVRERLEADGIWTNRIVADGLPAQVILETAEQQQVGAILMATHGRGGATRWVLGSVADKVVRTAPVPVLLRRPTQEERSPPETVNAILLPLDGSELSVRAVPYAIFLAKAFDATVVVIRTVGMEWITGPGPDVGHYASGTLVKLVEGDIRGYIETRVADLKTQGIAATSHFVPFSDPVTEVTSLAERTPNALIVMTTHGRSGLRRALLGSVTDGVIRRATAPVLVIPAPAEE
jgi:nucleotide-binding universal stress UspA family protein